MDSDNEDKFGSDEEDDDEYDEEEVSDKEDKKAKTKNKSTKQVLPKSTSNARLDANKQSINAKKQGPFGRKTVGNPSHEYSDMAKIQKQNT